MSGIGFDAIPLPYSNAVSGGRSPHRAVLIPPDTGTLAVTRDTRINHDAQARRKKVVYCCSFGTIMFIIVLIVKVVCFAAKSQSHAKIDLSTSAIRSYSSNPEYPQLIQDNIRKYFSEQKKKFWIHG